MTAPKVYVVWVGAYDSLDIDSIWSSRETAERRAASDALSHWQNYEKPEVVEMNLDPDKDKT